MCASWRASSRDSPWNTHDEVEQVGGVGDPAAGARLFKVGHEEAGVGRDAGGAQGREQVEGVRRRTGLLKRLFPLADEALHDG